MRLVHYKNDTPVLFISGMFAGSWIWDRTYKHITNSHKIMIQEPLCALGNNVDKLTTEIISYLNDLSAPVTIVGNSLGSLVGLNVACHAPSKVEQVLISGSAGFGKVNLDIRLSRGEAENISRHLMGLIFHDKKMIDEIGTLKTAESFSKNLRNIVGLIRDSNMIDGETLLSRVQCPVSAIWGGQDIITPFDEIEPIFEKLGIPFYLINGCGHSPMYEKPKEFAQWVNKCLVDYDDLKAAKVA